MNKQTRVVLKGDLAEQFRYIKEKLVFKISTSALIHLYKRGVNATWQGRREM